MARVAEHTRLLNRHVTTVAELQAEAAELDRQAEEAAARIRRQAANKREEILPHLAALLDMGHRPSDVELLCDVSRTQVKAARASLRTSVGPTGNDEEADSSRPLVPAQGASGHDVVGQEASEPPVSRTVDGNGVELAESESQHAAG
ncbi:hypothetical protein BJF79_07395 [Actinomadura sp. CNU-125]|nr:hypothetical protein BJF79_07395 [Actinomadura sp. CNU-125]